MKRHVPLYVKWLLGFSINLLLLGAGVAFMLNAWFPVPYSRLLVSHSRERIEAAVELLTDTLKKLPVSEWDDALSKFGDAYTAEFHIFDSGGIRRLAGADVELPAEIQEMFRHFPWAHGRPHRFSRGATRDDRGSPPASGTNTVGTTPVPAATNAPPFRGPDSLRPYRGYREARESRDFDDPRAPDDPRDDRPEARPGTPPSGGPPGPSMRSFIPVFRTQNPARYWLVTRLRFSDDDLPEGVPSRATLVIVSRRLTGALFVDYRPLIAMVIAAVALSLLSWFPFVHGITRSITQMTRASRRIAQGRFDTRVADRRRDELGDLGRSINHMAAQLNGLVGGQKRFLGDVAHELCSPLARLQVALGIMEQHGTPEQQPYIESACDKSQQIADLVNELLLFSKASFGERAVTRKPVPLRELADQAIAREHDARAELRNTIPPDLSVLADPGLLLRALANVLRNAVAYAGAGGPIVIAATDEPQDGDIAVRVSDHGPGVPPDHLHRLFEPFYRIDASRDRNTGGVGLGLTIVKTCIESCGGSVAVENRDPTGLEITLRLPRSPAATP